MAAPRQSADRRALLAHFSALAPDADATPPVSVFLPLPQHGLALRPEVVIIEGSRGAGKTALFRLIKELGDRVPDFLRDRSIPGAWWVDGFSEDKAHPSVAALDELVSQLPPERDAQLRAFWAVHLLSRLERAGVPGAAVPSGVVELLREAPHDVTGWSLKAEARISEVMAALDRVDDEVAAKSRYVFVSYDHLDRLGMLDATRTTRTRLVKALVALWLSNATRLRSVRGKIFLRPDLFEEAEQSFPDASKLRPRSVSLDWDTESLYRLVVRHLANSGPSTEPFRAWLAQKVQVPLNPHAISPDFGWVPQGMGVEGQRAFASALAGEVMGSGTKKGYTYRWIPARLKDAGGRITPRSMLRLIGYAAREALSNPPGQGALMLPTHLTGALPQVSRDRVNELSEEYAFVKRLSALEGQTVLMDRRKVATLLGKPSAADDTSKKDGDALLDEMLRIGVLQIRSDGRIDVPDIYRYGFGIKRKGGAAAPR
jgi:hypothetical protein